MENKQDSHEFIFRSKLPDIYIPNHLPLHTYCFENISQFRDRPCMINGNTGEKQLRNYMHRVEGANLIRTFIAENGFSRVVVPGKWLYELPSSFPERYMIVAEKVDLVSRSDTESAYGRIGKEQMHELATILYHFRGLNSTAANLPYTEDGKIAFIDTERWHHDKDLLHKIGDRIPSDRRKQAEAVFKELRGKGAQPFASAFK